MFSRTVGGAEVRKEPHFTSSEGADRMRADWVAAADGGGIGQPGGDCQRYVDVTISSPREGEHDALRRAEDAKRDKYKDKLQWGEYFVPYALSPYGAVGEGLREGVWGSAGRVARHLHRRLQTKGGITRWDREGSSLQRDFYEDFISRIIMAVTEDSVKIVHKVMDSIVGDLQDPLGVAEGWGPKSLSVVHLVNRSQRGGVWMGA